MQFDTLYGSGIGRYGSGQLPDTTYNASGTLHPLNEDMEMVGLTLHATHDFDLYVFGGREHEDSSSFAPTGPRRLRQPELCQHGLLQLQFDGRAVRATSRRVEQITVGLWDKIYNGDYGSFRFGLQYSYTHLKAFTGVGGAPHTDDNMIFTSFRYYPF